MASIIVFEEVQKKNVDVIEKNRIMVEDKNYRDKYLRTINTMYQMFSNPKFAEHLKNLQGVIDQQVVGNDLFSFNTADLIYAKRYADYTLSTTWMQFRNIMIELTDKMSMLAHQKGIDSAHEYLEFFLERHLLPLMAFYERHKNVEPELQETDFFHDDLL